MIPSDVLFESASHDLKTDATPYLASLAADIQNKHPDVTIRFVGHTDSRASDAYNFGLSERRAQALLDWFVAHGFEISRMSAHGAGESELLEVDVDESGQFKPEVGARNRRVEIQLIA